jgi:UDP-2,3-diacylglucosamine hydrolase
MNYLIFIADLHLQESEPKKTEMFLHFLTTIASKAKALYILGDLFEAWIGDDVNTKFNNTIKSALKQLTSSGVPVYLMRGNRDFLLGKKFAAETNCILITEDPTKIYLYGTTTLLTHGDSLCTNDHLLMWFRKYAHNPKLYKYFLMLPIFIRKFLAQKIRAKSKKDKLLKTDTVKDVNIATIQSFMHKYRTKQLIHGHVHKSNLSSINIDGTNARYITLDSWDDVPNYLIYYEDHSIANVR